MISCDQRKIVRVMSRAKAGPVNTCSAEIKTSHNSLCVFYDFCGDIEEEMFLIGYFLSSVVVLNVNSSHQK